MPVFILRQTSAMEPPPVRVDLIVTAPICLFLTISAVVARIVTRLFDGKRVRLEDYIIVFAGISFISYISVLFAAASAGQGAHLWRISEDALENVLLLSNVIVILYAPVMLSAKLSILLQLRRISFSIQKSRTYWAMLAFIGVNTLGYSIIFFMRVLACTPGKKMEDSSLNASCISNHGRNLAAGVVDILSNISLIILALCAISKLELSSRRNLGIASTLSIGCLMCLASIIGLFYNLKVGKSQDFTKALWPVSMWTMAELTCIIVLACCPSFPRLIAHIQGRAQNHSPYSDTHEKWISESVTYTKSRKASIHSLPKTQIFYPARSTSTISKTSTSSQSTSNFGNPSGVKESFNVNSYPVTPCRPIASLTPPFPIDRPISHLSYDSYAPTAIYESYASKSPTIIINPFEDDTPISPISPATSHFASCQVQHAIAVSVRPIRFSTIRKPSIRFPTIGRTLNARTLSPRVPEYEGPVSPIVGLGTWKP